MGKDEAFDCWDPSTNLVKIEQDPLADAIVDTIEEEASGSQQDDAVCVSTHQEGVLEQHKQKSFSCDKCEYVTSKAAILNYHKRMKHLGVSYSCDKCEYVTAFRASLKTHKEVKHEG